MVSTPNHRIDAVDALRGFALAGIVFAHMIEQFIAAMRPVGVWLVEPNIFDHLAMAFNGVFIMGKFFSIFAVLFGMSFAIMMGNAAARGSNFSWRFVWRLAILFAFGFIHSLVYRGDILTIYAAIGFCLPFFYRLSGKTLWFIAVLLFLGMGRYLFYLLTGTASLLDYDQSPESPVIAAYVELLRNGSFLEIAGENFAHGFINKIDFQIGVFGRAYLTLAYFLVGMWLVRSGIINNLDENRPLIRKTLKWSLGLCAVSFVITGVAFTFIPDLMEFKSWLSVFAFSFMDLFNTGFTAVLMSGFLLLYLRKPTGWLGSLAPYGRMALSNYLLQSLIGTFVLYGWGLGLVGQLHDWQTFLLSIVVILLQVRLSKWWLSRYYYGPFEWLWRCGTYFRKVKFARTSANT
jgi:uncharacterized protein